MHIPPCQGLSIDEFQDVPGDIKHRPSISLQHLLCKQPGGGGGGGGEGRATFIMKKKGKTRKTEELYAHSPPEEFSKERVEHREDKVHEEEAVQLLANEALPALRRITAPKQKH